MILLYILTGLKKGGISIVLSQRLNYLAEYTDFDLHILTEGQSDDSELKRLNSKIHFHKLNITEALSKKKLPFLGYFTLKRELSKAYQNFINTLQPDIITVFNLEGHFREIIPYLKIKAKKVIEIHGSYLISKDIANYFKHKKKAERFHLLNLFRISNKKLHNLYDVAVVLTLEDKQNRNYIKIPIFQIYNTGKINSSIKPFLKRENIIVAAGGLSVNKNFKDLIFAAAQLKYELRNWKIHIYGDGIERKNLENLIIEHKLNHIVFLKGNQFDMESIYQNAKILISTSLTEGFGMTLLEALNYKIPVIAYNCKCSQRNH